MVIHSLVESLLWIVLGVSLSVEGYKLNLGTFRMPGPGFMPFLVGAFLVICGLVLALSPSSKRFSKEEKTKTQKMWTVKGKKNFFAALIALTAYAILLKTAGFILTTFLFLFFLFRFTKPRASMEALILSGCGAIITFYIFSVWLECQFPKGILGF